MTSKNLSKKSNIIEPNVNNNKEEPSIPGTKTNPGVRGLTRKHIDQRLRVLYNRAAVLEEQLLKLDDNRFYRACIFGSARIKPESKAYEEVRSLAKMLSHVGIDILTGGGPGLMEAANLGAKEGSVTGGTKSLSIGLSIQLEWEPEANKHLDIKRHHQRFSSRLDDFMRLSHAFIVTPGGIGTVLELFFTWQLIQVKHMPVKPIILMGRDFWEPLMKWMREVPLQRGLVSPSDFECMVIVDTPEEAFTAVRKDYDRVKKLLLK